MRRLHYNSPLQMPFTYCCSFIKYYEAMQIRVQFIFLSIMNKTPSIVKYITKLGRFILYWFATRKKGTEKNVMAWPWRRWLAGWLGLQRSATDVMCTRLSLGKSHRHLRTARFPCWIGSLSPVKIHKRGFLRGKLKL